MTDSVSKKKRSEIMSAVKSENSEIEIKFRKALRKLRYKFIQNAASYYGKPDIVLKRYRIAVFVDSCFWHGCARHCRIPTSRRKYWVGKIERNKKRDRQVRRWYDKDGWKVLRFWEHDIKDSEKLRKSVKARIDKAKR